MSQTMYGSDTPSLLQNFAIYIYVLCIIIISIEIIQQRREANINKQNVFHSRITPQNYGLRFTIKYDQRERSDSNRINIRVFQIPIVRSGKDILPLLSPDFKHRDTANPSTRTAESLQIIVFAIHDKMVIGKQRNDYRNIFMCIFLSFFLI